MRVFGTAFFILLLCACNFEKSGLPTEPSPSYDPAAFSEGLVSFTIDDGRRSAYSNAIPALDSAGMKSTNYIITGRFGRDDYIGISEILSLQSRGHEVGAHTRTHQDLTLMSSEQMQSEIAGSRNDLLGSGIRNVETFAYPFGTYNAAVIENIRRAGFIGARSTDGGHNLRTSDRFILQRRNLGSTTTIEQVRSWVDSAIQDRSWLIFVVHHVDASNTSFSVTPAFFRDVVGYVSSKRIRVVTVAEGIRQMGS